MDNINKEENTPLDGAVSSESPAYSGDNAPVFAEYTENIEPPQSEFVDTALRRQLDGAKLGLSDFGESAAEQTPEKKAKIRSNRRFIKGDGRFLPVISFINLAFFGVWFLCYVVSLILRSVYFASAQVDMAMSGYDAYTLTFSSPLLSVLKAALYLLPVAAVIWSIAIVRADRKGRELPDSRLIIAVLCVFFAAGLTSVFDIAAAGLIF